MNKGILIKILTLFFLSFLTYSCTNNSTNTTTTNASDYFMSTVGNYWINSNVTLDANGNAIDSTRFQDSTFIVDNSTVLAGKTSIHEKIMTTKGSTDNYLAVSSSQIFTYYGALGNSTFAIPFSAWLLTADFDQSSWVILPDTTFTLKGIQVSGYSGDFVGKLNLNGKKGVTKQFTIQGNTVTAQEFIISININATFNTTISALPVSIPLVFTITSHAFLAKGIGIVQTKLDPQTITLKYSIISIPYTLNGSQSDLIRYNVK